MSIKQLKINYLESHIAWDHMWSKKIEQWPGITMLFPGLDRDNIDSDNKHAQNIICMNEYMYLNVIIANLLVTALLDTGSSINVMSLHFYNWIPHENKFNFHCSGDTVVLANNQNVDISGTVDVWFTSQDQVLE